MLGALVLASCGGGGGAPPAGYAAPGSRPHVLVYLVDTVRADHLGVYGYERDTSPSVDRLARDGIVFESVYAPSSWTRTSAASLLTGLDPLEHGVVSRRHRVPPRLTLASEHLSDLGYRTHALVTNPHVVPHWGFAQGFDRFVDLGATDDRWLDIDAGQVNEEAEELLPRAGDPPTFVYVHTIDPHGPNDPDEPYRSLFTDDPRPAPRVSRLEPGIPDDELDNLVSLYDAEIRFNDDRFGELLEELRRRGVYDDTLIVFTSDHGEEHLDHGRGGHGQQLFEEVVRVPLVVKLPGGELAGRRVEAPASLLDVLPTVLAAAGGAPPEELSGVDLVRLAEEPTAVPERPFFLDLELVRHDGVLHVARGVVYKRRKYIEEVLPEPRRMLFDLRSDPAERRDLTAEEPATAERLETMLREHREVQDEGLHLLFVGPPDGDAWVVRGRLSASAAFREVKPRQLEEGDRVSVEAEGGGVTFELRLEPFARRAFGDFNERLQDIDALLLRSEPPGAEVRLESLRAPEGLPIHLGAGRRPAAALPLGLAALDPELAIPTVGRLFRREAAAGEPLPPGLYVVAVPPLNRLEGDEMPEHLRERFEALGYL